MSSGQWIGTGLLLLGVLTGRIGIAGLLLATWLENVSAGIATVRALLRGDRQRRAAGVASPQPSPEPPATDPQAWPPPPAAGPSDPPPPPGARPVWEDPAAAPPTPAASSSEVLERWRRTGRLEISDLSEVPAGCAVPFFIAHYGMFTLVHGSFLLIGGGVLVLSRFAEGTAAAPSLRDGLLGALVLLAATVARAVREVDPAHAVKEAYAGVLTLHVAIVAGGAVGGVVLQSMVAGTGPQLPLPLETLAALALVALFTVSDLVRSRVVVHDRRR